MTTLPFRSFWRRSWLLGAAIGGLLHGADALGEQMEDPAVLRWPGATVFTNGSVWTFNLQIDSKEADSLRRRPREFVRATVSVENRAYQNVAVHLKGAVGSFRPLDDKPALTLDFSRFNREQTFHGLRRIHLNNSVEDPSYANEWLGSELFRAAGVPAPRVTHALVTVNGRARGLYVLKEGFTEDFLACHFKHPGADLFEPAVGHDIDQPMSRISLPGPAGDQADLQSLARGALDPDLSHRWQTLEHSLDLERFISFMAMEVLLCHRDGYCVARNNFRVYRDLDRGKWIFLPHGMDQLFGISDLPLQPNMAGLLSRALMETSEGRQRYSERLVNLYTNLLQPQVLNAQIDLLVQQLQWVLASREFAQVQLEASQLKDRILARQSEVRRLLSQPEVAKLNLDHGPAPLSHWAPQDRPPSGKMDITTLPEGIQALHISTTSDCSASWRTRALVPSGRYQFEGRVKTMGVKPLAYLTRQGAGLRIGGAVPMEHGLVGNSPWQSLAFDFEIPTETMETEFVLELRASDGEAWFDCGSLRVVPRH